jgi:hypothetical protein
MVRRKSTPVKNARGVLGRTERHLAPPSPHRGPCIPARAFGEVVRLTASAAAPGFIFDPAAVSMMHDGCEAYCVEWFRAAQVRADLKGHRRLEVEDLSSQGA